MSSTIHMGGNSEFYLFIDLRGCVDGHMRSIYICSRALYTWLYHIEIWKSHGARGTFLLLQSCHLTTVGNNRIISPP